MAQGKPNGARIFLLASIALVAAAGVANAAGTICGSSNFNDVLVYSGMAAIATGCIIVLCYMFGEFFQNARVITWAKTESVQVFASLAIALIILGLLGSFCDLKIGDVGTVFNTGTGASALSLPEIYKNYQDKPLYDSGIIYLQNLMGLTETNLMSLRYAVGAYEIRTTVTKMDCDKGCWSSFVGSNIGLYSGESVLLAVTNNLLSTATIAHLSAMFQYFTLLYINSGLFAIFLPMAIVIRSMPFMRQFGSALIAIFLSLYIMYPLMLVFDSVVASGITRAPIDLYRDQCPTSNPTCKCNPVGGSSELQAYCPGTDLLKTVGGPEGAACHRDDGSHCYYEQDMDLSFHEVLVGTFPPVPPFAEQARANALIFIIAVFLPAANFIVIAAMARGIGQLFGEDVDISRLGQMI